MGKKIVTHTNPDLDAVTSVWLLKRWLPEWAKAEAVFVPAGKTYNNNKVDSDPNILHVDTGLGKLDHHQTDEYTCAAKLTLEYIKSKIRNPKSKTAKIDNRTENVEWNYEALRRMVEVVNQVDHFQTVYYPEPEADYIEFGAEAIFDGWKLLYREQDGLIVKRGIQLLDGIYVSLVSKVEAEEIFEEKGEEFETRWGKGVAFETVNETVVDLAQKRGYRITVRRHPQKGHVRIKARPEYRDRKRKARNAVRKKAEKVDLTPIYEAIMEVDEERRGDWFLHESKTMFLNGSAKNPTMEPTKLSLDEIVEILQSIE